MGRVWELWTPGTPPGALQTVTSPGLRGEARVSTRRQLTDIRCGGGGSELGYGECGGGLCTQGDCSLMNLDCLGSRKEVSVAELGQDALEDLVLTERSLEAAGGSERAAHWLPGRPGRVRGRQGLESPSEPRGGHDTCGLSPSPRMEIMGRA